MKLPRFFNVDGKLVKFEAIPGDSKNFTSMTSDGKKYSFVKAMEEGHEIDQNEFNRLAVGMV